jgi:hypothetical protein
MHNTNNQKTSLNLHFQLFELSALHSFFTDSPYPSDIFDEDVVGFLNPSVYIWGVQNTEKYGSSVQIRSVQVSSVQVRSVQVWSVHSTMSEGGKIRFTVVEGTVNR